MTTRTASAEAAPADGAAEPADLHVETLLDAGGRRRVAMLRHPTHPVVAWRVADGDAGLQRLATAHLERLLAGATARADAEAWADLAAAVRSLQAGAATGFGWLPLAWGHGIDAAQRHPHGSFWVERVHGDRASERTAVLLAANRLGRGPWDAMQGTAFGAGLRVVAHVAAPDAQGVSNVRITGASFAGLEHAWPPAPPGAAEAAAALLDDGLARVARQYDLHPGSMALDCAVWGHDARGAHVALTGAARRDAGGPVWAWGVHLRFEEGREPWLEHDHLVEQTLKAVSAGALPRPTGDSAALLQALRPLPARGRSRAQGGAPKVTVLRGSAQDADGDEELDIAALEASVAQLQSARSDDLSAWLAYQRGQEFFARVEGAGFDPTLLFRQARLPLRLRHRARFASAPDGQAVNAQVRAVAGDRPTPPYGLEVHFGVTALTHRDVRTGPDGRPRSEYLGLAADPHWAWHEFGHVLAFASTGRLEFPFAHSAGDALAAVIADPAIDLRDTGGAGGDARGRTFPWVRVQRRHDRDATLGWCWCGGRNRRRLRLPTREPAAASDYYAEQLLSSSIFRLYRAIGGDAGDPVLRQVASDRVVALVMRAISLLGPSQLVPAQSADQFVSALIDADLAVHEGGRLHKVIRWAFEQQGLYASAEPGDVVEGVGRPPRVDVFIPGQGERARGAYAPVDLASDTAPWHVGDAGLCLVDAGGLVRVAVGNRGDQTARGLVVEAWARRSTAGSDWVRLEPVGGAPEALEPDGREAARARVDFVLPAALRPDRGSVAVLARAACPADPANIDVRTGLPCARGAGPPADADEDAVRDLVANDNNHGLRVFAA